MSEFRTFGLCKNERMHGKKWDGNRGDDAYEREREIIRNDIGMENQKTS
jgi:hypothetical protein